MLIRALRIIRFLSLLLPGALVVVLTVANEARAAVAFGSAGAVDTGVGTLIVPHPATVNAGDLLVLAVGNKYPPNGPATPAGWTLVTNGQVSGGLGPEGANTGTVYATVFVKVADGTEDGTNLTVTLTSANSSMGRMFRYTNAAGSGWEYAATNGSDNVTGVTWSVTGAADPGITSGDMLVVVSAINSNRFTSGWESESVSATGATFTTHTEQHDSTSVAGDNMALVVSDHTVTAGTASAAPVFTMTRTGTTTATTNAPTGASVILRIREVPGTTLGNGTDPGNASLAPGGAATMADAFTFQTSSGTDSVSAVEVVFATGTAAGLSKVEITNDGGGTVYGMVEETGSGTSTITDTLTINLSTNIPVTTTQTQYKIRVTPKNHPNMPVPPGAVYTVTAKISAWTGTNAKLGSDTAGTTVTIDNASPLGATLTSGTASNAQVTLNWRTSASSDFSRSVVLRWSDSAPGTEVPAEGTDYAVGNTIGTATVICVRTADGASTAVSGTDGAGTGGCSATALTNGQSYSYTVFQKDTNGNYDVGVTFSGSPFTPFGPGCYAVASASWDLATTWSSGSGMPSGDCPGTGNIPDASTPVFIGETSTAYNVTIPAAYTARAAVVTIGSNTANAKSLTLLAATTSLEVGGSITINKPGSNTTTNALNVNAGTVTVNGGVTLGGTTGTASRVARINVTTGTLTIGGNLVFTAGVDGNNVLDLSGGAATVNLAGAFTATVGTLFEGTSSTFNYNGTAAQTVLLNEPNIDYYNLHINNTSASGATLNANITTANVFGNVRIQNNGKLNDGGFTLTGGAGDTFEVANGATFVYTTNTWVSGFTRSLGATSTVEYADTGGQNVANENYGHLTLRGSGTKALPGGTLNIAGNLAMSGTAALNNNGGTVNMNGSAAQAITLNSTNSNLNNLIIANTAATVSAGSNIVMDGNFTINASGTFSAGSFLHSLVGNFTNNGTFTAGTSTVTFNSNNPQTIGGTSPTTFYNLTANNTDGGVNDIVLSVNTTVNNTLTFTAGNISTGSNTLIIGNTADCGVTGAAVNRHVIGYLRKNFTASLLDCTFEVGEGTDYAPVRMVFNSVTTPGYVTASTTVGDHAQSAAPGFTINQTQSVNRYWTLTQGGGLVFGSYIATFNYNASDLDGGVTPDNFVAQRYSGGAWFNTSLSSTTPPSGTATVIEGETGFGDFAIGESSITDFSYEREFIFTREIYY